MITRNVGSLDRYVRLIAGIVLLAAPFISGLSLFESGPATIISAVIGIVLLLTALVNFCPLYRILGIRTCRV